MKLAEWFLQNRNITQKYMLCSIVITENEVFKMFIKNWLFIFIKKTRPNYIASSVEEAWIWLILFLKIIIE